MGMAAKMVAALRSCRSWLRQQWSYYELKLEDYDIRGDITIGLARSLEQVDMRTYLQMSDVKDREM